MATSVVHCSTVKCTDDSGTDHFSYSGAIEVGDGEHGWTKLIVGTVISPVEGTGDITCALSIEVLEKETFARHSTP